MPPVTKSVRASMDATTGMIAPQISGLIAGAFIPALSFCYIKAADGKVYPTDGTAADEKAQPAGICPRAANASEPVTLFGLGTVVKIADLTLTPGQPLYLDVAPNVGGLSTTPTVGGSEPVAQAISTSAIRIVAAIGTPMGGTQSLGNVTLTPGSFLTESASGPITAFAGGGQAGAVLLGSQTNRIATVATAGDSVRLPAAVPGLEVTVHNAALNPVQVFGSGTDTINGQPAAVGVSMPGNSLDLFICTAPGIWAVEIGTGYAGSLFTESSRDGLVANPGGGKAGATPITTQTARVVTVTTAGDSVLLPPSAAGLELMVINSGANPMQVFGAGADTIDNIASGTGVSQMGFSLVIYTCTTAGAWFTEGLNTGYFNQLQTMLGANALVAAAAGTQAAATPLTALINRIATAAAANASVVLPTTAGLPNGSALQVVVINDGANTVAVYPFGADTLNGGAASAPFFLPPAQTVVFTATVAGQWQSSPAQIPLPSKFTLNAAAGPAVAAVGDLTGANDVVAQYSGIAGSTLTTRTAAQMIADAGYKPGQAYTLRIANSSAGILTVAAGAGVTLTGKVAIAAGTAVDYVVTVTGPAAITIQSAGTITYP